MNYSAGMFVVYISTGLLPASIYLFTFFTFFFLARWAQYCPEVSFFRHRVHRFEIVHLRSVSSFLVYLLFLTCNKATAEAGTCLEEGGDPVPHLNALDPLLAELSELETTVKKMPQDEVQDARLVSCRVTYALR